MSRFGERLALPVSSATPIDATCPHTVDRYRLSGQQLQLIEP
jgi:UDP-2-acetamido-3-amino-2,3-dideoxy-glucuronate N-acetyltransferase